MTLAGELLRCSKRPVTVLLLEEPAAGAASAKKARVLVPREASGSPQAVQPADQPRTAAGKVGARASLPAWPAH